MEGHSIQTELALSQEPHHAPHKQPARPPPERCWIRIPGRPMRMASCWLSSSRVSASSALISASSAAASCAAPHSGCAAGAGGPGSGQLLAAMARALAKACSASDRAPMFLCTRPSVHHPWRYCRGRVGWQSRQPWVAWVGHAGGVVGWHTGTGLCMRRHVVVYARTGSNLWISLRGSNDCLQGCVILFEFQQALAKLLVQGGRGPAAALSRQRALQLLHHAAQIHGLHRSYGGGTRRDVRARRTAPDRGSATRISMSDQLKQLLHMRTSV